MITDYLKEKKPLIDQTIRDLLQSKISNIEYINSFGPDAIHKLINFCTLGKSLRGVLVLLGAELYGKKINKDLLTIAAVIEIIHSCILIQDDIQDDDAMRRGQPTIWRLFQLEAEDRNFYKPKFYGQSMAMDVFLIGHYAAIEFLVHTTIPADLKIKLLEFLSNEIVKVGVAQSQDIYHGYIYDASVSIADIENVQLYKTGRYTLSMPLMLGAIYAGQNINDLKELEKVGEMLGIVFQIKDDELAIYADEAELGKKVGNDIAENKKTHYRELLYQRVNQEEKIILKTAFGNKNVTKKKLDKIRQYLDKYNIRKELQEKMENIGNTALSIINPLALSTQSKQILVSLVEYLIHRTK